MSISHSTFSKMSHPSGYLLANMSHFLWFRCNICPFSSNNCVNVWFNILGVRSLVSAKDWHDGGRGYGAIYRQIVRISILLLTVVERSHGRPPKHLCSAQSRHGIRGTFFVKMCKCMWENKSAITIHKTCISMQCSRFMFGVFFCICCLECCNIWIKKYPFLSKTNEGKK